MPPHWLINSDYLLFSAGTILVLGLAQWLSWNKLWPGSRVRIVIVAWALAISFLAAGWFWVDDCGRREQRRIESMVEGFAPTYAREMERMHHERITAQTAADDPLYLEAIAAEKRWLAANPSINDIYTLRKLPDGRMALIVDSETDYDRDGKYDADREQRTPIATVYEGALVPIIEKGLSGTPVFMEDVYTDFWGTWVSAIVPIYDADGRVDAALGVDFDADEWLAAARCARLVAIGYLLAAQLLALSGGAAVYLFLRRNLLAQQREQRTISEEKRKLDEVNAQLLAEIEAKSAMQAALARSEEKLAHAFHAFPMALAIVHAEDGKCVQLNPQFEATTGFCTDDVLGRTFWEAAAFRSTGAADEIKACIRNPEASRRLPCKFQTKTGETREGLFWTERFSAGGDLHTIAILQDVSDQHVLERKLRQSQKMEAVGHLAAGIAHDFNNLLTVIQGHASLRLAAPALEPGLAHSLEQISSAAERAAELTRQLLTFSRKQLVQKRPLRLKSIVMNLGTMLQRLIPANILIEYHHAPRAPAIRADACNIEQILINLVVNARDAMPQGGRISIETEAVALDAPACVNHPERRPGEFVCLTVQDSGCGMSPETLAHIFEPFFSTKEFGKGSGMGLATVDGIVAQHDGWIEVSSEVGQGTTFRLFFPVAQIDEVPDAPPQAVADLVPKGETILIAEDNPAVRELARSVLEEKGYHVLDAATGTEAAEISRAFPGRIDLLLTDMVMPGGVSGSDLAEMVAHARPETRIIVSSGYSLDGIDEATEMARAIDYLPKPYLSHQLLSAVSKALGARSPLGLAAGAA